MAKVAGGYPDHFVRFRHRVHAPPQAENYSTQPSAPPVPVLIEVGKYTHDYHLGRRAAGVTFRAIHTAPRAAHAALGGQTVSAGEPRVRGKGLSGLRDGLVAERESFGARRGENAMTQKITLASSRDIPLNKLVVSQSNVRRVKSGISVDELAQDIARRGLLQSLNVRPVLNDGEETGISKFRPVAAFRPCNFSSSKSVWRRTRLCHASCATPQPAFSPKTIHLPKMCSASLCMCSINIAPSRRCATRACPMRTSPPRSLSA
jgi:hypothetical protein